MERVTAWAEKRTAPVVATVAMLVLVMAWSLLGHSIRHGGPAKLLSPSDLWSLAASSSAIAHGHFSHIYVRNGALTSPPAFEIALAPVLLAGQALGLSPHLRVSGQPLSLWFVLGPAALLLASSALFAVDAVARWWRFSDGARMALALVGALAVANVAGGWGHPEDCVALALVVWAALQLERNGRAGGPRAALLLGIGIAFQPFAILGVAPVLARLGWRGAARLWWRLLLPSLLVLVPALAAEPHRTLFVLVRQPFQPRYISYTPLTHLAPVIGRGLDGGGPTRLAATAVAACLAVLVCRRRHDLATVLTMMAVAFLVRLLLETELNWYYLWPVPALCLLLSLRRSAARFGLCSAALVASMVLGDRRVHHIALWWPAVMATLAVMLLSTGPSPRRWVALAFGRQGPAPAGNLECEAMVEPLGAVGRRE
jgi:hypothetical protein